MNAQALTHLQRFDPDPEWLAVYATHLAESQVDPTSYYEAHHIIPVSLNPETQSFAEHPWNRAYLTASDHLIAHYYLVKAYPAAIELRYAFCAMASVQLSLLENDISPQLLQEMAREYEFLKTGLRWVTRDGAELKILPHEQDRYLTEGWSFGRALRHTEASRLAMSVSHKAWHALAHQRDGAYDYLPRGDHHFRRIYGVSPETRAKLSKALTGLKQDPEAVRKRALLQTGKHWKWSEESRQAWSQKQTGSGNNRYGQVGAWAGKQQPESMRQKRSESLKQFYSTHVREGQSGEDHWNYGQHRPDATKQKIAASLTGRKDSQETRDKKALTAALAKMPAYTVEEIQLAKLLLTSPTLENAKQLRRKQSRQCQELLWGIYLLKSGSATDENRRYWRTADVWLNHCLVM